MRLIEAPAGTTGNQRAAEYHAHALDIRFVGANLSDGIVTLFADDTTTDEQVDQWRAALIADPDPFPVLPDPATIGEAIGQIATLLATPATATTVAGLRADVNAKMAAVAQALGSVATLMGGN